MEVVVPLCVERIRPQPLRVVALVLEHEMHAPIADGRADLGGHRIEERVIVDRMYGIEAKPVDPIVVQPHQGIVDEVARDGGKIDRHRPTPRRLDLGMEERARIAAEVIPVGAEMIVHDIEKHREAELVGGIDERLHFVGCAIAFGDRIGQHAVIAPVARAAKGVDRHEFDRGHAQRCDFRQTGSDAGETAEHPHMHFLDDHLLPGPPLPVVGPPAIGVVIDHHAPAVDAPRLRARRRIGHGDVVVDAEAIPRPCRQVRVDGEPAFRRTGHRDIGTILDNECHTRSIRRPDPEISPPVR